MLGRLLTILAVAAAVALAALGAASCSISDPRIGIEAPPFSKQSFAPMGDFLVYRCGTIDCHGAPGRNFRVWGCDGMRLDAGQAVPCVPDDAGAGLTTIDEYQATYRSLVGLEPQVMTAVWSGCENQVGESGVADYPPPAVCHPELLTMVQKARGTEKHKGGQLLCLTPPCPPGIPNPSTNPAYCANVPCDSQDVCIVSWLEGNVNKMACQNSQTIGITMVDAATE
jgi:hypothetical protein